ncbi:SPFH domain-containing protein [Dyadobacter chenwenxiniae]|uniref:SPFH domain-containing protein n=1 Tax=Dyadobacter chenwenxiniae TaxID=2906456 RepID=A0A9X1TGD7_9BACT|nr:SPFH domain-containing protein [Dyadobacter chenwenxiniae]MCF0051333.1 SPFH domain-containing protein [Dyadobacter chenwenxiniae]MCF0065441.1 SPFH domain-containing protein [Dyadobacter chenwenxiniae]UON82150.1 SPFH domain-containing protein [Dyadobacter chenwenxiniae]
MNEKELRSSSGFALFGLGLLLMFSGVGFVAAAGSLLGGVLVFGIGFVILIGLTVINPNEAVVTTFFGDYMGTMKQSGLRWVNPLFRRKKISLRARNLNGQKLKVNDKLGNPIEIAAVVVWRVGDTAKASFEVDDYVKYVEIQSEAAVRHLAGVYAYDTMEDEDLQIQEVTLRDGSGKINEMLEAELTERLSRAGIDVLESRISHLAYAPEIAGAMLQRQQASAVVAARRQIVNGAVGMVDMALAMLSEKGIVQLDEERKAAMVSNLLVVLCGEKAATPILNAGTLYP